jgi:hypothetical protein
LVAVVVLEIVWKSYTGWICLFWSQAVQVKSLAQEFVVWGNVVEGKEFELATGTFIPFGLREDTVDNFLHDSRKTGWCGRAILIGFIWATVLWVVNRPMVQRTRRFVWIITPCLVTRQTWMVEMLGIIGAEAESK